MTDSTTQPSRFGLRFILPLGIFAAVAVFFLIALNSGDPTSLPSALIGKPVPQFDLPSVDGLTNGGKAVPGFTNADLAKGEVTVVTVWASWCAPCVEEQPTLMALKIRHKVRIVGMNYKDEPQAARGFLAKYGNPFDAVGTDRSGRVGIDWGVTGVPETYVVDGRGQIVFKYDRPLTESIIQDKLLPAIAKAGKGGASG